MSDVTNAVLAEIATERAAQDAIFRQQDLPDGTGITGDEDRASSARHVCDVVFELGEGTYRDVFYEEVCEAFAESDPAKLRAELVQAVAVGVKWIEAIDRRAAQ